MAGKADFTEEEWDQLRKGATAAGLLVSVSDRSFLDSFKEASSFAKYLLGSRDDDSQLVRELASEHGTGFGAIATPGEVNEAADDSLRDAVATLQAKAPDEVEAYRAFVLELAETVSKAATGGDEAEAAAIERIEAALA
ncbi:hypothetical protein [Gaiella sp.]|jgi:hypothetical protein|uniref:hypothetical protein n=1 Tax=Gaiella sp. TaxID=2663207 RepID=UPI002E2F4130|nr:hypothetical protein [Gaiella sp.]HEX5583608.1 hypothetical protein [Gaiella sp.]